MVVLILTACPVGLRGHVTRWLLEISPGVFVGKVSSRVRDELWERVVELAGEGRALVVFSRRGEQGLSFLVNRHDWTPCDFDGLTLIRRPSEAATMPRAGWSNASRRRLAARRK